MCNPSGLSRFNYFLKEHVLYFMLSEVSCHRLGVKWRSTNRALDRQTQLYAIFYDFELSNVAVPHSPELFYHFHKSLHAFPLFLEDLYVYTSVVTFGRVFNSRRSLSEMVRMSYPAVKYFVHTDCPFLHLSSYTSHQRFAERWIWEDLIQPLYSCFLKTSWLVAGMRQDRIKQSWRKIFNDATGRDNYCFRIVFSCMNWRHIQQTLNWCTCLHDVQCTWRKWKTFVDYNLWNFVCWIRLFLFFDSRNDDTSALCVFVIATGCECHWTSLCLPRRLQNIIVQKWHSAEQVDGEVVEDTKPYSHE